MLIKVISRAIMRATNLNGTRFVSSSINESNTIEKTLNQVTLLGRAGTDPQKRGTVEHPVVIFSMATHTNYKYETGEFLQRTEWHKICVFRPNLRQNILNYLRKGQRVLVTGRLSYGEFKDENGHSRLSTAIIADEVIFFYTP